jgi:hypothetical protein
MRAAMKSFFLASSVAAFGCAPDALVRTTHTSRNDRGKRVYHDKGHALRWSLDGEPTKRGYVDKDVSPFESHPQLNTENERLYEDY